MVREIRGNSEELLYQISIFIRFNFLDHKNHYVSVTENYLKHIEKSVFGQTGFIKAEQRNFFAPLLLKLKFYQKSLLSINWFSISELAL